MLLNHQGFGFYTAKRLRFDSKFVILKESLVKPINRGSAFDSDSFVRVRAFLYCRRQSVNQHPEFGTGSLCFCWRATVCLYTQSLSTSSSPAQTGFSGSSDAPQGVRRPSFRWAIEQQLGLIFDFLESETELLLIVGRGAVPMRNAQGKVQMGGRRAGFLHPSPLELPQRLKSGVLVPGQHQINTKPVDF